jgi:hypothetical protein
MDRTIDTVQVGELVYIVKSGNPIARVKVVKVTKTQIHVQRGNLVNNGYIQKFTKEGKGIGTEKWFPDYIVLPNETIRNNFERRILLLRIVEKTNTFSKHTLSKLKTESLISFLDKINEVQKELGAVNA